MLHYGQSATSNESLWYKAVVAVHWFGGICLHLLLVTKTHAWFCELCEKDVWSILGDTSEGYGVGMGGNNNVEVVYPMSSTSLDGSNYGGQAQEMTQQAVVSV